MTSTAWNSARQLELGDWLAYGRRFGQLSRSVNWWIGDWLRYGNAWYGERYARAARATGYDVQSLMNMVYVASRFEPPRRRPELSWSHHAELAALEPAEQERWLELVKGHRLSVHSLRLELRTARKVARRHLAAAGESGEDRAGARGEIVCPKCRHVIETNAARLPSAPAASRLDESTSSR